MPDDTLQLRLQRWPTELSVEERLSTLAHQRVAASECDETTYFRSRGGEHFSPLTGCWRPSRVGHD